MILRLSKRSERSDAMLEELRVASFCAFHCLQGRHAARVAPTVLESSFYDDFHDPDNTSTHHTLNTHHPTVMPTAIVTGATGMIGRAIVDALGKDPKTWPTVYAFSRSQRLEWPANVQGHQFDLQADAQEMAKELGDIKPEYIFFTAYLAQDTEEAATKVNGAMLENFLTALEMSGASRSVKRILLTTGAKQYGLHLGVPKQPMEETDPWLSDPDRPPNFYYAQQKILAQKAEERGWDWVVTYPNDVIGVAKGNFMNLVTSIGLYCAVTKELGQELVFPGSPDFYTRFDCFTSSVLHAQFNLWAALEAKEKVANQAFNIHNGDVESWQNLWLKLAKKFGLQIPETMFTKDEQTGHMSKESGSVMELHPTPPVTEFASSMGLKDTEYTAQSRVEAKVDLVKWSKRSDVKEAWERLVKRDGLEHDAFEKATWSFLGFVLGRNYDIVISMSKARKAGWTGYVDSWDCLDACLDELVREKVLPKF
jgi:nucleoside-diphosphate-sugar epimerase